MPERLEIVISGKDEFSKTFGKLKSALPSIKTLAIGAGAAVAGLGTALFAMAKSTAEAYDRVQKFSDQLGLTTEFISKMQHAAELSGVQNLNKGLQMLQVRIGESARGIGQGKDALEALGVSLYDANGQLRTAEGILPDLAESFYRMTNATERAEAASKIFGQRGIEMVQLFKDGRAGLEAMTAEAEKFGLVVSAQAGANAAAFNDALTRVAGSLRGLKNLLAEQLMPYMTATAMVFADFIAENRELIALKTKEWLADVVKMLIATAKALEWIDNNITDKILDFFFGPTDLSKMEILQKGLEEMQQRLRDLYTAKAEGELVDDHALKLLSDTIALRKKEIAALREQTAEHQKSAETQTSTIDTFVQRVKTAFEELREVGTAPIGVEGREGLQGIPPFTEANLQKSKEVIEAWRYHQMEVLEEFYGTEEELTENFAASIEDTKSRTAEAQHGIIQQGYAISRSFGGKLFALNKALAISEAIMNAYRAFTINVAEYPYPWGAIFGAIAKAAALAQVAAIAGTTFAGAAHGGLTSVPREQTYLLDKGERVVSAAQNADLMEFIERGGASRIDNVNIHVEVAPNATNANALMDMDERVFEEIVEEKIIPALSRLSASGITYD